MGLFFSKLLKFSEISHMNNLGELMYNCDYSGCNYHGANKEKNIFYGLYETENINDLNSENNPKKYCLKHSFRCNNCDKYFGIKDSVYEDYYEDRYCKECYQQIEQECPRCFNNKVPQEFVQTVDGKSICKNCVVTCEECKKEFSSYDYMTEVFDDSGNTIEVCGDCYGSGKYSENEFKCYECKQAFPIYEYGRSIQIKGKEEKLCRLCGKVKCEKCKKTIKAEDYDDEAVDFYGFIYCKNCYGLQTNTPEEFKNDTGFDIASENIYLEKLKQIVPITAATLKQKYPEIFYNVFNLVKFVSGGKITKESIEQFQKFKVEYSGWGHFLQRSLNKQENQLVLNVVYKGNIKEDSKQVLEEINQYYYEKGHPYKKDQIGWVRIELGSKKQIQQLDLFEQPIEKEEKFILIEEIQSDVDKFLFLHKNTEYDDEDSDKEKSLFDKIRSKINTKIFAELKRLALQFPDSAMQSILNFAKKYNYKTLYFHTYENKVELHGANPPKSYYTVLPARYNFRPTEDKPFGLDGSYLKRYAALRKLSMKYTNFLI